MDSQNEILTVDDLAALLKMKRSQKYDLTRKRARVRHAFSVPLLRINSNLRFRASSQAEHWSASYAHVRAFAHTRARA
jgi:hypothetical protein